MKNNNLSLALKYRPKNFNEFVGNESIIASLKSIMKRKEGKPHSFMFSGPSGCGKTTLARIIAEKLKCSQLDFRELNMSNTRGIDTIRELASNTKFAPTNGLCKIYLLDEAHMITRDAQHAVLKILEDTPPHVYFIICTTEPNKLLETILTRCTKYKLIYQKKINLRTIITRVLKQEHIEDFPENVITKIVDTSEGSPRNALVLLDSVIDIKNPKDMETVITDYSIHTVSILTLCEALLNRAQWKTIASILCNIDRPPEDVRYSVLGYMNGVLLNGNIKALQIIKEFSPTVMYSLKAGLSLACYNCVVKNKS